MNESPIPQPHRFTCPRCGFGFDGNFAYCPNCGQPISPSASSNSTLKILAQVALCLVALCSGGFGACIFLLVGAEGGLDVQTFFLAAIPVAIAALCIWGVFRLGRRPR